MTKADLHFTSALISGSVLSTMLETGATGANGRSTADVHWQRVSGFTKLLEANPSFQAGERFYLASSVPTSFLPRLPPQMSRDPLMELLRRSPRARR